MMNPKTALVPGSFDPPTLGHTDLIQAASRMFDKVYVTVFHNPSKNCMFSVEQRYEMLRVVCRDFHNVTVDASDEFLAVYTKRLQIGTVVKGIRNTTDFEYEYTQATANAAMNSGLQTIFIPAAPERIFVSSSFIRTQILFRQNITGFVHPDIEKIIKDLYNL